MVETNFFIPRSDSSASNQYRRSETAATATDAGSPAVNSFALVCGRDLRSCLVLMHTGFYRRAASSDRTHWIRACCGICRFRSVSRASSRSHIHFSWSSLRVSGDCFRLSFVTNAPIAHRTSLRCRCAAAELCGRYPRPSVRSRRCCCSCWRRGHPQ